MRVLGHIAAFPHPHENCYAKATQRRSKCALFAAAELLPLVSASSALCRCLPQLCCVLEAARETLLVELTQLPFATL